MLVKIFQFKIEFKKYKSNKSNECIDYDLFFKSLVEKYRINNDIFEKKRQLIIKEFKDTNLIYGCLISFKNEKTYCQYKNNKFDVASMKNGADYNFFIFDKKELNGVWSSYPLSASLSTFDEIVKIQLLDFTNNMKIEFPKSTIIQESSDDEAINKRYSEILNIEYYTECSTENSFLSDEIKYKKNKLIFIKNNLVSNLLDKIRNFCKNEKIQNLKIQAKVINRKTIETFNLDDILIPKKEYDYDDFNNLYIKNLDTNDLDSSAFINVLKEYV